MAKDDTGPERMTLDVCDVMVAQLAAAEARMDEVLAELDPDGACRERHRRAVQAQAQ